MTKDEQPAILQYTMLNYLTDIKVQVSELTKELGQRNIVVTRSEGRKLRDLFEKAISTNKPARCLLNFSNIKAIDASAADEAIFVFHKRIKERLFGQKFLVLSFLNKDTWENIDILYKQRNSAILTLDNSNKWSIIGQLSEDRKKLLKYVIDKQEAHTYQVADLDNTSLNLASTKLAKLYEMGLVSREEMTARKHGLGYIYKSIV